MNKKKIVYIVTGAELLVLLLLFILVSSRSGESAVFDSSLMEEHSRGEGYEKTFSTPEFPLKKGIYHIRIRYLAEQKDRKAVNAFASVENSDPVMSRSILSDSMPLFGYRDETEGRFYVLQNASQVSVKCRNLDADYDLKVESVAVEYLRLPTAAVASCLGAFLFLVIDLAAAAYITGFFAKMDPKKRKIVFALAGIIVLSSIPALFQGIPDGDDLEFHCYRIVNMAEGLKHGCFPVRLYALYGNGYGYPEGIMYGDVLLYLPVLVYIIGFPLITAYKVYLVGITALTAVISYYCFKRISGGDAFLGTLLSFFYLFSACRLMDVCSRAAVGEYSAFAFLPLVAAGLYRLWYETPDEGQKKQIVFWELLAGFTGLLQSNLPTSVMTGVFFVVIFGLCYRVAFRPDRLVILLSSLGGTVLLNLGYLVPLVHYYLVFPLHVKFDNGGIQAKGLSIADLFLPSRVYPVKTLGIALMLSLAWIIYELLINPGRRPALKKLVILSVLSVFMTTVYFPYDWLKAHIPLAGTLLSSVQFPWRYLVIATLVITLGLCFALRGTGWRERSGRVLLLFALSMITLEQGLGIIGAWSAEETGRTFVSAGGIDAFYGYNIYRPEYTDIHALYELPEVRTEGEGIETGEWTRDYDEVFVPVINNGGDGAVELPVLAYRGYRAEAEGVPLQTSIGENYKLRVTIPAGFKGTVHAYFKESWVYRLSELVTIFTIAGFIVMFCVMKKRREQASTQRHAR
ncbi:MAG: hypothetical protein K5985_11665 [Lachnospiraceae bacterium]|nr:hypothetical protein [Lachnospiraceae bacterium]